jgi:hypothetical protein
MDGDQNRRGDSIPESFVRGSDPRVFGRIEEVNPKLNAVVQLCSDVRY